MSRNPIERPAPPAGAAERGVTRRRIWVDLLLYPTHTLPTAAAPVLVGAALAWRDDRFAPQVILIGFLASWLIHVGGVLADNHALITRHPQVREHPELNEAVRDGSLKLPLLKLAIGACFLLPALALPYLLRHVGWPVAVIGALGAAASFGYAGGPNPYAKSGLADLVFLVMFGVVAPVATYYVSATVAAGAGPLQAAASLPPVTFLVGLPAGLLIANVMVIDDIRDHVFDRDKGWRTTPVRFGPRAGRIEFCLFAVAAYCLPVWFHTGLGFGLPVLLPLLTAPFGVRLVHTVLTEPQREALIPMTPRASFLALGHSALLAVGIALS